MFQNKHLKEKKTKDKLLYDAAEKGDLATVKLHLTQGSDPNAKQKKFDTPLMAAAAKGFDDIARALVAAKADVTFRNKRGKNAAEIAKEAGHAKCAAIIIGAQGDKQVFDLLEKLDMLDCVERLVAAQVKYADLQVYTDADLEKLGFPYGPRNRLLRAVHSEAPSAPGSGHNVTDGAAMKLGGLIHNAAVGASSSAGNSPGWTPTPPPRQSSEGAINRPYPHSQVTPGLRAAHHIGEAQRPASTSHLMTRKPPVSESGYSSTIDLIGESDVPVKPQAQNTYAMYEAPQSGYADPGISNDSGGYAAVGGSDDYAATPDLTQYAATPELNNSSKSISTPLNRTTNSIAGSAGAENTFREINYAELILEEEIGRGAFGAVYKGTWRGAAVAVKKLHEFSITNPQMQVEFRREAAMMTLVDNHPNVVKFVGACSQTEPYCLVSKFCEHGSLESFIRKEEMTEVHVAKMLKEASAGILHLHCEGVIHRDLAARNVLVGENYTVAITDFGFARIKDVGSTFNTTVSTIGPVKYMAPEALKEKKYSEKSDTFSFGVVIWEVLTKKVPYEGEDLLQIAMQVIQQKRRLKIPEDAPTVLKDLMRDCWEEDPEKRPNFHHINKRLTDYYNELNGQPTRNSGSISTSGSGRSAPFAKSGSGRVSGSSTPPVRPNTPPAPGSNGHQPQHQQPQHQQPQHQQPQQPQAQSPQYPQQPHYPPQPQAQAAQYPQQNFSNPDPYFASTTYGAYGMQAHPQAHAQAVSNYAAYGNYAAYQPTEYANYGAQPSGYPPPGPSPAPYPGGYTAGYPAYNAQGGATGGYGQFPPAAGYGAYTGQTDYTLEFPTNNYGAH